jgi:hypothetical protein
MELLKDTAPPPTPFLTERRPSHTRNLSTPANPRRMSRRAMDERRPLLRRRSHDELDSALDTDNNTTALAGGTVLGIHNLAIVMPQFIVRLSAPLVTSCILTDDPPLGRHSHQRHIPRCRRNTPDRGPGTRRLHLFWTQRRGMGASLRRLLHPAWCSHCPHGTPYSN